MSTSTKGASAPHFAYVPKNFFRTAPHPNQPQHWIVVNLNGAPISKNNLPMLYWRDDGQLADIEGCTDCTMWYIQSGAEKHAAELNESVIQGFDIKEDHLLKRFFNRVEDSVLFWTIMGMMFSSGIAGVVYLLNKG